LIACGALGATGPDGATYHAPVTKLHLWACVSALIAGAITLSRPKGTAAHRIFGLAYVGATILCCVSSLAMFPSTGQFTPFHAVAAQNLMLVGLGTGLSRYLRRRVRDWRVWRLRLMTYSYVSLVVTGLRFAMPVLPQGRLVPAVIFVAVPIACWIYIEQRVVPAWRPRAANTSSTP
jgi:uncharacterized membrane protein